MMSMKDAPATTVTARVQSLRTDILDGMYSPSSTDQGSYSLPLTLARSTGLEPSV